MPKDKKPPTGEYPIGYGKPPVHTRFKPGQSGNRKGRPRGSKNVATVVEELWNRKMRVTIDGRPQICTAGQAMLYAQFGKAVKGDTPAFKAIQSMLREAGLIVPAQAQGQAGGVLLIPKPMTVEEWEAMMAEQRPKREEGGN